MAARKRRKDEAQAREARFDVRLTAADRSGAPLADASRRRAPPRSQRRVEDDEDEAPPRRPVRKARSSGGGGRNGRWRFGRMAYWGAVMSLWLVIGAIGVIAWVGFHLPPIQSLEIPKRPPSIQILGVNGRVLATRGDMGGAAVPLKAMPAHLPKAFIAIEDRRFFSHHGIDPLGLMRAMVANVLRRGVSQGGSTITQQLAKNLFLTQDRTLSRKLQEAVLALWLERKFSKEDILELYLNRVYFGSGAYGVEAAAQRYFGKSARQATLAEAALLAGLVKSPSRLAPTRNFDGAERRAQLVLAAMADARLVKADTAKVAMAHPPKIVKASAGGSINYAADFVTDALNDLVGNVEEDVVVETGIDPVLQAAAEKALLDELTAKGDRFGVQQGALVAMSPDGTVRALVGGRHYADSQFNRAVAAKRQPGSAFKPFVYLTALERGLTPDTVRDDKPIQIKGWKPENYSREYFGPVTLTQALSMSLNTVSVRLTLEFGPIAVMRTAHRLGISSKLEPNASLALGTSEVSVLELTSAFAPFANGGMAVVPQVVERVRTAAGKTIYTRPATSLGRVVEPRYVSMMNAMMRETLLSGTARKAELPNRPAAGKTGTSQDFRDAWFVGYTGHLIAGVWLGNDDASPTKKLTGGGLPVDIWSRFMKAAHQNVQPVELPGLSRGGLFSGPVAGGPGLAPAPVSASGNVRPQSGLGLDSWFLDRILGGR